VKIKKPGRPTTEIVLAGECGRCGCEVEVAQAEARPLAGWNVQTGTAWGVKCPGCAGVIVVRDQED
jgi:hypothetical protein